MALRERIRTAINNFLGDRLGTIFGGIMWQGGNTSSSGVEVTCDRAMQLATVFSCVRVLAESIATLPLLTYRRRPDGGKDRASDHYLYSLLKDQPNQWQTSFEWREMMMGHLCLRGNAYSHIVGNSAGVIERIVPLSPDRMKVEMIEGGSLRYTYTNDRGTPEPYSQGEILHLRFMSLNGLTGLSPIAYARNTIGLAIAMEEHGGTIFKNGAKPGLCFKSIPGTKPEAVTKFSEDFRRMTTGENRHRTFVLPTGLEPVELGLTNDDAEYLDNRKYQRDDICGIFRVPPHMVGNLERATFSNIEQQSIDFVNNGLMPWCRRFEQAIQRDLVTESDVYFVEFLLLALLRGDAASRGAFYSTMFNMGVLSTNDIRELENMNPVGPDGDKRFVQLNMTTLDKAGEEPPAVAPPVDNPPSDTPPNNEPQNNSDGLSAAWVVYDQSAKRFLRWEADAIARLAGKGGNFLSAVDVFYDEHKPRTKNGMLACMSLLSAMGEAADEIDIIPAMDARRLAVIDASGNATAATLKATIEQLTESWLPKEREDAAA